MIFRRRHSRIHKTHQPPPPPATPEERERAEKLLEQLSLSSEDFFKLWPPDKYYFWSPREDAYVAYKVVGPIAFVIADPVAATHEKAQQVLDGFLEYCQMQEWRVCVILVSKESSALYKHAGLKVSEVGASALIDIAMFVAKTATSKWWRWQRNRGHKLGYTYERLTPPHSRSLLAEVRNVSDIWLTKGNHHEQGFALGYFDDSYLQRCPLHLLRNTDGLVVAFANEVPIFNNLTTATTDLIRFTPDAPNAAPYLLLNLLQTLAQAGHATHFDLGYVPMGQMRGRFVSVLRMLSSRRFSAAGLEQFKDKFDPAWQPNYFAYTGDLASLALIALNLEKAVEVQASAPKSNSNGISSN